MRNAAYEQALNKQGLNFDYMPSLDLKAIDSQASLRNQARLLYPLDEELIDQYHTMEQDGCESPAIVVYKKPKRSIWVIIDGNQRKAAKEKAGRKTTDAYVVKSEDAMVLDRLTWSFNNLVNGKRLSAEEALEHAKTMVLKYGMEAKAAAKEWGLNQWTVKKAVAAAKVRETLRKNNATEVCKLEDHKLEALAPIQSLGDDVLTTAAWTVHRCGLSERDIEEMKREISRNRTHQAKVASVIAFGESDLAKQRRAETQGGRTKTRAKGLLPSESLTQLLKKVNALQNKYEGSVLRRKGVGYKEVHQIAIEVVDRLILDFGLGGRLNEKVG